MCLTDSLALPRYRCLTMPTPERPARNPEQARPAYLEVARFGDEQPAARAYQAAQTAIAETPCDLSTFRLQLDQVWHVAVLGAVPSRKLDRQLRAILATGEPTSLPPEVVRALIARRAHATRLAPWVERHY